MNDISGLFLPFAAFVTGMIAPGPSFLMVLRNSLGWSPRTGVITAMGVITGDIIYIAYCIAGMGLVISQSILLFNILKSIGAAYLFYVGYQALRSQGMELSAAALKTRQAAPKTARQAFPNGLVTTLFNPKATMLFLALFTQMIDPTTPTVVQILFGAACIVVDFIWYSSVALVMGLRKIRRSYARASKWLDRVFGMFFIALGVKLALLRLTER